MTGQTVALPNLFPYNRVRTTHSPTPQIENYPYSHMTESLYGRWKEECQTITHKFEGKIEEMRSEITQLRRRNEQLTALLKDSQNKTAEVSMCVCAFARMRMLVCGCAFDHMYTFFQCVGWVLGIYAQYVF